MPAWLGITLGDPGGIGPEVTLKALASLPPATAQHWRCLLIGDEPTLHHTNQSLGLNLPIRTFHSYDDPGPFLSHNPAAPLPAGLPQGHPLAAQSALAALTDAAQRALRRELAAIITAPINKEAIIRFLAENPSPDLPQKFIGQTEYLSQLARAERTAMMLLGHDDRGRWLRVALVTTHLPLRDVPSAITIPKTELAIELAARACAQLKLPRARIAVCGLNPHAGEGGQFGDEETTLITPAIQNTRARALDVHGPFPADTIFHYAAQGQYDAVVAMYHDQGLAPLKLLAFENGINWTLGLPFIRTSPDHGTAYNIAGQNKASPQSLLAALNLAQQLAQE